MIIPLFLHLLDIFYNFEFEMKKVFVEFDLRLSVFLWNNYLNFYPSFVLMLIHLTEKLRRLLNILINKNFVHFSSNFQISGSIGLNL